MKETSGQLIYPKNKMFTIHLFRSCHNQQIFETEQTSNLVIKQQHLFFVIKIRKKKTKKVDIVHMVVIQGNNTYVLCKKKKKNDFLMNKTKDK
jgi:hypothetical protein